MDLTGNIPPFYSGKGKGISSTPDTGFIRTSKPGSLQDASPARDLKKAESALEFERVFARYLVGEMTKDSFLPADNNGMPGAGSEFYKDLIVDSLSNQLARERRLGFADLIMQFWNRNEGYHEK